jgi:tetratricopeptide (TPR) repeat protein
MKSYKLIIFFFLIFIFFLPTQSSQKTTLNQLFNELIKIDNYKEAQIIEKKIWAIWHVHPKNIKLTEKLKLGTELMYEGSFIYALKIFDNIIYTDPQWSEGWNKRATLLFLMNDLTRSLEDIEKVLILEPRHFGALSGKARIFIKLQEYEKAIKCLKKTLKFYPSFKNGELIIQIEKIIKEESI